MRRYALQSFHDRSFRQDYGEDDVQPGAPGEILREYIGSTPVGRAAKHLRVARSTLSRLLNGRAAFTASMALRLSDAFGTEPGLWLDLQQQYDLWHASRRRRPKIQKFPRAA
ncbi:MAG TPA: HigA family addiction module antitoxin [Terracidiphilus sp.]